MLKQHPENIPKFSLSQFRLAMGSNPECMDPQNPVESYRKFYETKQERFKMSWSKRNIPEWFNANL
jgi:hypothetical protein